MNPSVQLNGRCLMQSLTGVQRYVHELARELSGDLVVHKPWPGWANGIRGHLWEQGMLPLQCDRRLLWSPGNAGPLACRNQVLTLHDASVLDHPEWFEAKYANWYKQLWPLLVSRVRGIITVSEFSKERLMDCLRLPESMIHVVPNGVSDFFKPQPAAECEATLKDLGIPGRFFLHVGSIEPRKNLDVLLQAWKKAALADFKLVVVGERGKIFDTFKAHGDLAGVQFTGRISDRQLLALYSSAHAFLSGTAYEGFGFPPLEAMACGSPCIVSDIPPHREVGGDAPTYVPPGRVEDWCEVLREAAGWSASECEMKRERGLAISAQFSWSVTARKTMEILNRYSSDLSFSRGARIPFLYKKTPIYLSIFGKRYLRGWRFGPFYFFAFVISDLFWRTILGKTPPAPSPDWKGKRILFSAIAHLGDLLILTPALQVLRREAEGSHIHLIAGSWSAPVAGMLLEQGFIDEFTPYDSTFLDRSGKFIGQRFLNSWKTWRNCRRKLGATPADISIDFRIQSPNSLLLLRLLRVPFRAGYGVRELAFTLHAEFPYLPQTPTGQLHLNGLTSLGFSPQLYRGPVLQFGKRRATTGRKFNLPKDFFALHPTSGDEARNLSPAFWADVLSRISLPVVILGSTSDRFAFPPSLKEQLILLQGLTTFEEAADCICLSRGLLAVDSVFVHVALAAGTPVAAFGKAGYSNPLSFPCSHSKFHYVEIDAEDFSIKRELDWISSAS